MGEMAALDNDPGGGGGGCADDDEVVVPVGRGVDDPPVEGGEGAAVVASSSSSASHQQQHISAWEIILTKVHRITDSNISLQVLFHEMSQVLDQFLVLVTDSCTITTTDPEEEEADGGGGCFVSPDKRLCNFLQIPHPVSRIYLRDMDAFRGNFQAAITPSKLSSFHELTKESLAKHVKTEADNAAAAAFPVNVEINEDVSNEPPLPAAAAAFAAAAFHFKDEYGLHSEDAAAAFHFKASDAAADNYEFEEGEEDFIKEEPYSDGGNDEDDDYLPSGVYAPKAEKKAAASVKGRNQRQRRIKLKLKPSSSSKGTTEVAGCRMEKRSAGISYDSEFWVDAATFLQMKEGKAACQCPRCPKAFKRVYGLVKHWRSGACASLAGPVLWREVKDEESGGKRFACAVEGCGDKHKTWRNKTCIEAHVAKKHAEACPASRMRFQCDSCPQKFLTKSLMSHHKWNAHKETRKKSYTCSLCGRVLNKRQSLIAHERSHTGERPFKCPHCDLRFITKQSVSRHAMTKHAAEIGLPVPVHVCELCGKEFKSKKNLKEHRYYHADNQDNRHQCQICSKVLKQKNSYLKHMVNVHKMGHTCDLCNKTIATLDGLKLHKRDQHGVPIDLL